MWKRGGWTKRARFARKTLKASQGKWTRWEDMFTWHVWRGPSQETFLPGFSRDKMFFSSYYTLDIARWKKINCLFIFIVYP